MQRFLSVLIAGLSLLFAPSRSPAQSSPPAEAGQDRGAARQELTKAEAELQALRDAAAAAPQPAGEVERLRKQVELQQKQLEVLEKMARLLSENVRQEPSALADLEARSKQAARRDDEVGREVGDLREQMDADQRNGPALPPTLRELFFPTRTNESPLAVYGTFAAEYQSFQDAPNNFPSPVFSPHFYLLLNEQFLLEVNPEIRATQVELESCQLDWFLHDNLTLVFGRFYSPLGFFNERLHTSWIYKTPDRPLMFAQVLPSSLSFNGVMARGAAYLGDHPVKLEYAAVVTNGFSLPGASPSARDFADLREASDAFNDVNSAKAFGGRVGLSFPSVGLIVGLSGLANGDYDTAGHDLNLWDLDVSYHRGNWDFRFEYAMVNQQAPREPIRRQGLYAQAAYRPYDSLSPVLQKLEAVFRYDWVKFEGIDLARTGLAFGGRERIPIDRNRYTFGVNYWAYESLVFRAAYEVYDELSFREFRDNGFVAQVAWGF